MSEIAAIALRFRVDGRAHIGGHVTGTVHKVLNLFCVAEHLCLVTLVRYSLNNMGDRVCSSIG